MTRRFGRGSVALAALALAIVVSLALAPAVVPGPSASSADAKSPSDVKLVSPSDDTTRQLWPYTSRATRFETATLPINLVVHADAETVRFVLVHEPGAQWRDQRNYSVGLETSADASSTPTNASNGTSTDATATNGTATNATATTTGASNASGTATASPTVVAATATGSPSPSPTASPSPTDANASGRTLLDDARERGIWQGTHGGTRYTYVHLAGEEEGRWLTATAQLHNGDYFGSRAHLRLYEAGSEGDRWTAIQAHNEHWDWFGLRHSVGSLSSAQHEVERSFYGKWYVTDVSRKRFANGGRRFDGWVSVVELRDRLFVPLHLALLSLLGGAALVDARTRTRAGRRRLDQLSVALRRSFRTTRRDSALSRHHAALFLSVAAIPPLVRAGAIAAERAYPDVSPLLVGGPFYVLLVTGLPVCAALFSRRLSVGDAFVVAFVAFGTGTLVDYAYIEITSLQFGVVLHRVAAASALGLLAAGGARATESRSPLLLLVGVLAWGAVVLGPPLGVG